MATKNLPTYELRINPEKKSLVSAIALVDEPAIESDFLAFSKAQMNQSFSTNDERMELIGAAMIPDMRIYRQDANTGEEYNVFFKAETIREIAQEFFKQGFQKNLNLDHTATPAKSYVFQSYIVDEAKGMSSPKGLNLPDGSWVVGVKVQDKQVWQDIKDGKRKGFSVEGLFQFFEAMKANEGKSDEELLSTIKEVNNYYKTKSKMHLSEQIKSELKKTFKLLFGGSSEAETASKVYTDGEINISERKVGGKVELVNADSSLSVAPDGDYEMQDGFKFTVKDGLIASIDGEQPDAAEPVKAAKPDEGTPAEEATETPDEEAKEDADEDQAMIELQDRVTKLEEAVGVLGQAIDQLNQTSEQAHSKASEDVSKFTKQVAELNETIKTLAKIPVEVSKTSTSNLVKDNNEKMFSIVSAFAQRK